jgi:hypothetical protein
MAVFIFVDIDMQELLSLPVFFPSTLTCSGFGVREMLNTDHRPLTCRIMAKKTCCVNGANELLQTLTLAGKIPYRYRA